MATYEIRPLQLKILEILQAVDKTCKEHNLRYYLTAGTMLGAVRHKGFIPWDDDADIAMPRPDYEALIANASQWLPKQYELICAENDNLYPLPFAKVQDAQTTMIERAHLKYLGGVYIDIFPLDGMPDSKISQWWHFFRYQYYKRINYFVYRDPYKHGHGLACVLPLLIQKVYSKENIRHRLRKLQTKYDFDKSHLIVDHDDGLKGILPKDVIGTPTPILFENIELLGVEHPDKYLSQKYGDYRTIPPHDDQHQHNFFYLDLDKPYSDFDESNIEHSI